MKTRSSRRSSRPRAGKTDRAAARRARLRAAANAYFKGLATKTLSFIPYDANVILHAPLAPGGAANPLKGKAAVLTFFEGVLPAVGLVKVLDHYINAKMTRICTEAEVEVGNPPATLRVADCFTVNAAGKITAQENHFDPRPALGPNA